MKSDRFDSRRRILRAFAFCFICPGAWLFASFCAPAALPDDTKLLALSFAGRSVPAGARVVWKRDLAEPAGLFSATLVAVVQAGGRDRLLIARNDPGASARRVLLSLDFAAPRTDGSAARKTAPPAGLQLQRELYTGDAFAGLRRIAFVRLPAIQASSRRPTLWIQYAGEAGVESFLYSETPGAKGLERSYDSQMSPVSAGAFLYFNGVETQACNPESGVCPAFDFVAPGTGENENEDESAGDQRRLASFCASGRAFTIQNLAPQPHDFELYVAFLSRPDRNKHANVNTSKTAGDSLFSISSSGSGEDHCRPRAAGEFSCRIGDEIPGPLCLTLRRAGGAADTPGLLRISAGRAGVIHLPPSRSLRRTVPAGDGRAYLLPFSFAATARL